tara:strand:+ start:1057 stop:2253 length:1197 start_codon:yes stop_codon:yes gene_type:complete
MAQRRVAIVGIHEWPSRFVRGEVNGMHIKSQSAAKALDDAGLSWKDIDALYDDGDAQDWQGFYMPEYFDLDLKVLDTTQVGGSSFEFHAAHAMRDLGSGKANVALLTYGQTHRSAMTAIGTGSRYIQMGAPDPFSNMEDSFGPTVVSDYSMMAMRYMHDHGIKSEDLAQIAVDARYHALRNPDAVQAINDLKLRGGPVPISIADVLSSPMIADPLHLLDCCMTSDGGGAVVLASEDVVRDCKTKPVWILGSGEAVKFRRNADDLTVTGGAKSGPIAFGEAGVRPDEIDIAMVYDSFTITALSTLEDLGFCKKGEGGDFVKGGALRFDGAGKLSLNTDGGGLSSNHPGQRGIFLLMEAARQLRGESTSQVNNAKLAVAHGTGGSLSRRHASATIVLGSD